MKKTEDLIFAVKKINSLCEPRLAECFCRIFDIVDYNALRANQYIITLLELVRLKMQQYEYILAAYTEFLEVSPELKIQMAEVKRERWEFLILVEVAADKLEKLIGVTDDTKACLAIAGAL